MKKPKNLKEALSSGFSEKMYFSSNVPFYNQGFSFMLYRVDLDNKPTSENYLFVIPARYNGEENTFIELIPTEVFKAQHLNDLVFNPKNH